MTRTTGYDGATYTQVDMVDGAGDSGLAEHSGLDIDALWLRVWTREVAITDEFDHTFSLYPNLAGRRNELHFD